MNIVRGRMLLHNISVRTIFSESMYKLMFNNETRCTRGIYRHAGKHSLLMELKGRPVVLLHRYIVYI